MVLKRDLESNENSREGGSPPHTLTYSHTLPNSNKLSHLVLLLILYTMLLYNL